jgi:hypothetical protein
MAIISATLAVSVWDPESAACRGREMGRYRLRNCYDCGRLCRATSWPILCPACRRARDRQIAERAERDAARRRKQDANVHRLRRQLLSGRYEVKSGRVEIDRQGRVRTYGWEPVVLVPKPFVCARCGTSFPPQRSTARYCSPNCRLVAWRARK